MFFTLKRCFVSVSDKLQSVSVKFSGLQSPEIRKVLTEVTLKVSRVPWAKKMRHGGGPAFLIENRKIAFQGVKHLEKPFMKQLKDFL